MFPLSLTKPLHPLKLMRHACNVKFRQSTTVMENWKNNVAIFAATVKYIFIVFMETKLKAVDAFLCFNLSECACVCVYRGCGGAAPSRCSSCSGPLRSVSPGMAGGRSSRHTGGHCSCGTAQWRPYRTGRPTCQRGNVGSVSLVLSGGWGTAHTRNHSGEFLTGQPASDSWSV